MALFLFRSNKNIIRTAVKTATGQKAKTNFAATAIVATRSYAKKHKSEEVTLHGVKFAPYQWKPFHLFAYNLFLTRCDNIADVVPQQNLPSDEELRNMRAGLLATDDINIPMIGAKQQDLDNVRDKLNLEQYRFAQYIVNSSVPRPAAVNLESLVRTHTFKRKITHMLAHQFLDFFDVDTPKSSLKRYPDHPLVVSISPTINVANTVGYAIFDAEKPEDPFVTLINENPSINIKNDQCQIAADLLSGAFAKARAYEGTGDVITVPLVSLRGRYVSFWRADFPRRQLEEIAEGKLPADRAFLRYYEGVKRARDRVGLDLGNPAERKLAVKNFIALLRTYQANPGPVPGPKQQQQQQEQQQQQQEQQQQQQQQQQENQEQPQPQSQPADVQQH